MTALLEQAVTKVVKTNAVTTELRPLTVEAALKAVGLITMPREIRQRLKREGEISAFMLRHHRQPVDYREIMRQPWNWYTGECNLSTGTFEGLDIYGQPEQQAADPIFLAMAANAMRAVEEVPGITAIPIVNSLWTDPIGGIRVTRANGSAQNYWFYGWLSNKTTWPPERK